LQYPTLEVNAKEFDLLLKTIWYH